MNLLYKQGAKFRAQILGINCEGVIAVKDNLVFLCQNFVDGHDIGEEYRLGYDYSWCVNNGQIEELINNNVTNFKIFGRVPYKTLRGLLISKTLFDLIKEPISANILKEVYNVSINIPNARQILNDVVYIPEIFRNKNDINSFQIDFHGNILYHIGIQNTVLKKGEKILDPNAVLQIMKASKFIRLFKPLMVIQGNAKDEELVLNRACELYASRISSLGFEFNESNDVHQIYKIPTAPKDTGTLGTSCMRLEAGADGKIFLDFYNNIPQLSIIYTVNSSNQLTSRALKWSDVETSIGKITFIDRIYGNEKAIEAYKKYAKSKGWFWKVEQSYANPNITNGIDVISDMEIKMPITLNMVKGIPYLDTMNYIYDNFLASYPKNKRYIRFQRTYMPMDRKCPSCGRVYSSAVNLTRGSKCMWCY
jgi:hypothetical protein